jgi:hypothetical protein
LEFDTGVLYYLQRNSVGMYDLATGNGAWIAAGGDTATVYETSFAKTEDAIYIASAGCRYITVLRKDLTFAGLNSFSGDDPDDNAGYIALGPDAAYCVSEAAIYTMPLTRGPIERIATLDAWGGPAVFYDGVLYFTNVDHQKPAEGTPALRAFHVSDGSIETLQVLDGMSLGLVLDRSSERLYFGDGSAIGAHGLMPGLGSEYEGPELVRSLAQSETDLYFLSDSGIFRLPKVTPRISPR